MKNEAKSQTVFAVSYVRNVRGRAMLLDSTVHVFQFHYLQETEKGKFTPTDDYIAHVVVTKDNKNVFLVTDK